MTPEKLQESIADFIAFIEAMDPFIPGKIDPDLVSWLKSVEEQTWTCELLVKVLGAKNTKAR